MIAKEDIEVLNCLEQLRDVLDTVISELKQPEVIHCRDCKYYREYGYVKGKPKFLPRCAFNSIYVNADDFCSRSELKE